MLDIQVKKKRIIVETELGINYVYLLIALSIKSINMKHQCQEKSDIQKLPDKSRCCRILLLDKACDKVFIDS